MNKTTLKVLKYIDNDKAKTLTYSNSRDFIEKFSLLVAETVNTTKELTNIDRNSIEVEELALSFYNEV